MQEKPSFLLLTLLDVMSVLVTGMLMTNEGVQNGSHGPHEAFHPRIRSYLHGTGGGAVKTEESDTQARKHARALCLVILALG